jgi:putative transposase
MGRIARVVVPGIPHHLTQRGNRRQETFFGKDDYRAYLRLMKEWCGRQGLRVWAYCLMPNHVHLIIVPPSEEALCRGVGEAHRRYTRRVNFREGWLGHLWQGRFASFVMDEPYLMAAARYIERNPVRAKLVGRAEDWPFSSAAAHAAGHVTGKGDLLAESAWLAERTAGWVCSWAEFLRQDDDPELAAALRRRERTGRPLGDEPFLRKVGRLLGRDLLPKKPGPPPKEAKKKRR